MTRQPNAVDFWRGFALITIFIDHIPAIVYSRYTLVNVSISDAADLFVFLVADADGTDIRVDRPHHPQPSVAAIDRLLSGRSG